MNADAAMNLVVQAGAALVVLVARELHAIQAEIGGPPAGPIGVFGVDLRQGNERTAVFGPRYLLRQITDRNLLVEHRTGRNELGPQGPQGAGHVAVAPRVLPERGRV